MRRTLYDKLVDAHQVCDLPDGDMLIYVDFHIMNEYTSPQAFSGLDTKALSVWRPEAHLAVVDHVNATRSDEPHDAASKLLIDNLEDNCTKHDIAFYGLNDPRQGIEHVVVPEQGLVTPGMLIACGDSHTTTYGAYGALGFGIGTSEVEHVLATQTMRYKRMKTMRVMIDGETAPGVTAKDIIMKVVQVVGAGGAMLSVPILMYGFGFDAKSATTAALAVVLLAALSGAIPKARKGQILYRDALVIVGLGLVTNLGFASIVDELSNSFISSGFAAVLILAGLSMLRTPKFSEQTRMPISVLIVMSLVIGSITGLFGIGGGFLAIPILVLFFQVPQNKAAGTSLLIIVLNSITAFLGHYKIWSEVNWTVPIAMAVSAVVISQLASGKSAHISPVILKRAFAVLLFSISAITLLNAWVI